MSCLVENNRTCNFFDCTDTPLSISGNVISIATFFIAALATYLAFFQDVRDIPQSAEDYSSDIRSLHDELWTISDIHGQLAKLVASNEKFRISDVQLQSRLQQGQNESLKEARKFLDDYSASYQDVFTDKFKRHRWTVRLKWLLLQKKVAHFKNEASELRSILTLDLLTVTLNMNIALQESLHQRDTQTDKLSQQIQALTKAMGGTPVAIHEQQDWKQPDSPSPSVMMDPTDLNPPSFMISPPEAEGTEVKDMQPPIDGSLRSPSRSPSPFSTRRPLGRSLSSDG